jgi:hypothetical protein
MSEAKKFVERYPLLKFNMNGRELIALSNAVTIAEDFGKEKYDQGFRSCLDAVERYGLAAVKMSKFTGHYPSDYDKHGPLGNLN